MTACKSYLSLCFLRTSLLACFFLRSHFKCQPQGCVSVSYCYSPESSLVSEAVKEDGTETVAHYKSQLLEPVKPRHPAGSLPHGGDVGREAVDRQVPDGSASHHVVDIGGPEVLQPQLSEPDLVDEEGPPLQYLAQTSLKIN